MGETSDTKRTRDTKRISGTEEIKVVPNDVKQNEAAKATPRVTPRGVRRNGVWKAAVKATARDGNRLLADLVVSEIDVRVSVNVGDVKTIANVVTVAGYL